MTDNEESLPNSPEDSSTNKPLTEDQEEALNKIMAELQGANGKEPEPAATEKNSDSQETEDGLTGEQEEALNKIMAELQGANGEEPEPISTEKNGDSGDADPSQETENGLTDEQEEALQKIMAEIEGTSKDATEPDKSTSNTSITAEQEETLNRIVAELEDNAPSDAFDKSENQDDESNDLSTSDEPDEENLSQEQEEALQKIMAEIDSKSSAAPESKDDSKTKTEPDQTDTPPANEPDTGKEDKAKKAESSNTAFEELDLSEFESELQKVVSEAKKEASSDKKTSISPKTTPSKKFVPPPVKDNVPTAPEAPQEVEDSAQAAEKNPDEAADSTDQTVETAEKEKEPTVAPAAPPAQSTEAEGEIETPKIDPPPEGSPETKTKPVHKATKKRQKALPEMWLKKLLIGGGVIMVLILVAVMVRWIPSLTKAPNRSKKIPTIPIQTSDVAKTDRTETKYPPAPSHQVSELTQAQNDSLTAILNNINILHSSVSDKIKEISDLRLYYEQGIRETEEELIRRISDRKITQLNRAVSDQRIKLGLQAIQRRKGYIAKLQIPLSQLMHTSEELLYLERKANIFLEMIKNTSGINLDPFEKQVFDTIEHTSTTLNNLSIDQSSPDPDSLETIWKEILAKIRSGAGNKMNQSDLVKQNRAIWKEICAGNFARKWALTQLNENAAQCLLQYDGKDLYLNQLTILTPEIAQILSHWKGEWLGLNGLETLSPEVARHLARWQGKRLSLNGLTELSPKATFYLSKWQGSQLELIGLKHIGLWENPKVELFVSDKLRTQIPK